MTKYGHFLTRKQVQTIIDAVDENDDGEVDYNEFLVSKIKTKYQLNLNFTAHGSATNSDPESRRNTITVFDSIYSHLN